MDREGISRCRCSFAATLLFYETTTGMLIFMHDKSLPISVPWERETDGEKNIFFFLRVHIQAGAKHVSL